MVVHFWIFCNEPVENATKNGNAVNSPNISNYHKLFSFKEKFFSWITEKLQRNWRISERKISKRMVLNVLKNILILLNTLKFFFKILKKPLKKFEIIDFISFMRFSFYKILIIDQV